MFGNSPKIILWYLQYYDVMNYYCKDIGVLKQETLSSKVSHGWHFWFAFWHIGHWSWKIARLAECLAHVYIACRALLYLCGGEHVRLLQTNAWQKSLVIIIVISATTFATTVQSTATATQKLQQKQFNLPSTTDWFRASHCTPIRFEGLRLNDLETTKCYYFSTTIPLLLLIS